MKEEINLINDYPLGAKSYSAKNWKIISAITEERKWNEEVGNKTKTCKSQENI